MTKQARLDKLRRLMAQAGLDAVALVPGPSLLYLTGAQHHLLERMQVLIVPLEGRPAVVIPALEVELFESQGFDAAAFPWTDAEGHDDALSKALATLRLAGKRLGVEGKRMRFFEGEALRHHEPALQLVDADTTIAKLRLNKDAEEIAMLRRAIEISERGLRRTLRDVRPGMTEIQIGSLLTGYMREAGSHALSFEPLVLAGENSARPHGVSRDTYTIQPGDALLFDFGATYNGYNADLTRTVFVGEPNDHARALYAAVRAANERGRAVSRPGVTAGYVDENTASVLEAHGFKEYVRHRTGHGLGLDIHEAPYITRGNEQILEQGMVFTVEPGLYHEGALGVRIEDNVVITHDGAESLSTFPRDLMVIG